jgi:diguanylate cyclase (GGDEF)-like protein
VDWGHGGIDDEGSVSVAAARQASVLFFAAGVMTLVNNHLPDADGQVINDIVGMLAIVVAPLGWLLPWRRWPLRVTLVYFPFCLGLLVVTALYGSFAHELYGLWYVVAFVWVGLHHPKRTSLALAVPAAIAYVGPLLHEPNPSGSAIRSVAIAIPAAVLIGEILSAANTALRHARVAQEQASGLLAVAAVTDDLTGLGNRRHVNTLLDELRAGDALLLLDLDHFKELNDRLGHLAGDEVLADLGRYLIASTRDGDAVARYGGEEFLLVLRQSGPVAAAFAADRLLTGWRTTNPLVTFSIGIAVHDHHDSPWATLAQADTALYHAKSEGRDRAYACP